MESREMIPYDEDKKKWDYTKEEAYLRAKERVKKIVGFYWHLAVYVIINIFLIILFTTQSGHEFWSFGTFSTAFFWGIGLSFHYIKVFGMDVLFGKEWEKRKIQEFMEKEQRRDL